METRGSAIDRESTITEQIKIRNSWWKYFHRWWWVHYALGIALVILSVTVASKPRALSKNEAVYEVIAWLAAITTGLLTFLGPEKRARSYRRAWSVLSSQITRYLNSQCTLEHVLKAYDKGEQSIHDTHEK
jgi:hypothetical protein